MTEQFSRMIDEFIERYSLPDGTVYPRVLASSPMRHGDEAVSEDGHGAADQATMDHGSAGGHAETAAPQEVLLASGKWYYRPGKLRLDVGQPYRFRMMALDVSHGASIQFGNGGRMVRLRPGQLTEMDITFTKPGRYLVHCTVYCGMVHDYMQATIEVV